MIDPHRPSPGILPAMSSPSPLVRQEHIRSLGALAGILAHAEMPTAGPVPPAGENPAATSAPPPPVPRLRDAISAECVQCGIRLTGAELLALAEAGEAGEVTGDARAASRPPAPPNPKVARLRLGYCARSGCDSCYYRVTFEPRPGLDWTKLLPGAELEVTAAAPAEDPGNAERQAAFRSSVRRTVGKAALALGALVLLLVARHWYQGGTIPYLREPEKFDVQVAPTPGSSGPRPPG